MAFDNVTFFELHLDSPSFGGDGGERVAEEPEMEMDAEAPRRGRAVPIGLLVLAGIGAAVVARRMRGGEDIEVDLEAAEAIAVE